MLVGARRGGRQAPRGDPSGSSCGSREPLKGSRAARLSQSVRRKVGAETLRANRSEDSPDGRCAISAHGRGDERLSVPRCAAYLQEQIGRQERSRPSARHLPSTRRRRTVTRSRPRPCPQNAGWMPILGRRPRRHPRQREPSDCSQRGAVRGATAQTRVVTALWSPQMQERPRARFSSQRLLRNLARLHRRLACPWVVARLDDAHRRGQARNAVRAP